MANNFSTKQSPHEIIIENQLLKKELRYAREAANITAALVVKEFEKREETLNRLIKQTAIEQELRAELEEHFQELKLRETVLRDQIQFQTKLLESISIPIVFKDIDGFYLGCNSAFERFTGLQEEKIVGRCAENIIDQLGNIDQKKQDNLQTLFLRVNQPNFEGTLPDLGSGPREVILNNTSFVDHEGTVTGEICSIFDVTEIKELKKKLLHVQKIEAMGTLASGIAHDFKNILTTIIGYTELCKIMVEDDQDMVDNLDQIHTAGQKAEELVQQILTFSRQDDDDKQPLQLSASVTEVINFLGSETPASIKISFDNNSPGIVLGNPTQIHQLLMNICSNAVQAIDSELEENGTVHIKLSEVAIQENEHDQLALVSGDYLKLSVTDNGCGIESSIIDRIFEPFFSTKGVGRGSGMGLSTVHGIVENHDGQITVESKPGQGSTFTVYLPIFRKKI